MTALAVRPLLQAPTPEEWFATHLETYFATHDGPADEAGRRWLDAADLLGDAAAFLRVAHTRILATDGGTPQMAAKWLVAWSAGTVADAVGFVLAAGAAGLLADSGTIGWRLHPDGWVDRVRLDGCTVLVTAGHDWAGQDGVEVVDSDGELLRRTVESLVTAVRPVVDAVRGLARVGAHSMWAEVADGIGMSPTFQPDLPVRQDVVDRLRDALAAPGAPWRVSPTLRTTTAPWGEPVYLGQKGGCCLAYQRPEPAPPPESELTDELGAYYDRFPRETGVARVCSTCSLRDAAGCEARQLYWLEQRR